MLPSAVASSTAVRNPRGCASSQVAGRVSPPGEAVMSYRFTVRHAE